VALCRRLRISLPLGASGSDRLGDRNAVATPDLRLYLAMFTSVRPFRNASQTALVFELAATAALVLEW